MNGDLDQAGPQTLTASRPPFGLGTGGSFGADSWFKQTPATPSVRFPMSTALWAKRALLVAREGSTDILGNERNPVEPYRTGAWSKPMCVAAKGQRTTYLGDGFNPDLSCTLTNPV